MEKMFETTNQISNYMGYIYTIPSGKITDIAIEHADLWLIYRTEKMWCSIPMLVDKQSG